MLFPTDSNRAFLKISFLTHARNVPLIKRNPSLVNSKLISPQRMFTAKSKFSPPCFKTMVSDVDCLSRLTKANTNKQKSW